MKKALFFIASILVGFGTLAQERLKPGLIYEQGKEIYAPVVGFRGVVPDGWFGTLPQEEEVFLLIPQGVDDGYMFINANPMSLNKLRKEWTYDLSLTDEIVVSMKGEPTINGNKMSADFDVTGTQKKYMGFATAIDGGHGWTISISLLAPVEHFEAYRKNFDQLVASAVVEAPSLGSIYADFNWPEFLKNKYLMSFLSTTQYKEQNEVWLCADGSFRSKIKSKGMLKVENNAYKGKKKGTWKAEGVGEKGQLHLYFTKNDDVVLDMEIKDDKIFVNGGRFLAMQNNECR